MAAPTEKPSVFPEAPHQPSLSLAINASTKDLHDVVNMLIMKRIGILLSAADYRLYREGICSFYHVYSAFERTWAGLLSSQALPSHIMDALHAIYDPRLSRATAFAADLSYLFGLEGFDPTAPPARPQVAAYVKHIENSARENPHVLIAYAHSYYMALFAGGKVLRKMILAKNGLFPVWAPANTEDEARLHGTNMFAFPVEPGEDESLRTKFKAAMEIAEEWLSEIEKTNIIEESRTIFRWNERLIYELDEICAAINPAVSKDAMTVQQIKPKNIIAEYKWPLVLVGVFFLWMLRHCL